MKFSEKLKNIRLRQGITQKEFASMLGINYSAWHKYELGLVHPNHASLLKICKRFPQYTLSLVINDISIKQVRVEPSLKKRIRPTKEQKEQMLKGKNNDR